MNLIMSLCVFLISFYVGLITAVAVLPTVN